MAFIPYSILTQDQSEELAPNGTFVDTWRITFQGPSGTTGTVKIPANQYSPGVVDATIQGQLQNIEATHALGSAPAADLGLA